MPFHIEVATPKLHARSFNLTEEELGRTVLDPWLSGRPILLGDRRWTRDDETSLRILEGPQLSIQDLAFSQGWANAQRVSTDVTGTTLEAATEGRRAQPGPTALVVKVSSPLETVAELAAGHGTETVSIDQARERIDGRDPKVAAVILVVRED